MVLSGFRTDFGFWKYFLGCCKFSFWNLKYNKFNIWWMSNNNDSFRWFESPFSRWRHLSTSWWSICCRKSCLRTLFVCTLCLWRIRGLIPSFWNRHLLRNLFQVDSVNLLITTSTKLSDRERDVILPEIVLGFQECCAEAGANMTQSPIGKKTHKSLRKTQTSSRLTREIRNLILSFQHWIPRAS